MAQTHPGMQVRPVTVSYKGADRISSRDHVLEIIQYHLDRCCHVVTAGADDPFAGKFAAYEHTATAHEVLLALAAGSARARVREFPLMTLAYVGHVSALALSNMIHAAIHAQAAAVAEQQSNGVWVPVAWRARTEMVERTARVQVRDEPGSLSFDDAQRGKTANESKFEETQSKTERVVVAVVWWDVTQSPNIDMAAQFTDGKVAGTIGPNLVSRALAAELTLAREILTEWAQAAPRDVDAQAAPVDAGESRTLNEQPNVSTGLEARLKRTEVAVDEMNGQLTSVMDLLQQVVARLPETPKRRKSKDEGGE